MKTSEMNIIVMYLQIIVANQTENIYIKTILMFFALINLIMFLFHTWRDE